MTAPVAVTLAPARDVEIVLFAAAATSLDVSPAPTDVALLLSPIFRGLKGDPGPTSSIALQLEQVAVDGVNTINVPVAFSGSRLFINGLRQSTSSYAIAGIVVTLPASLNCVAGDILTLEYLPS